MLCSHTTPQSLNTFAVFFEDFGDCLWRRILTYYRLSGITILDLSFNQFVQWPDLSPLVKLEELVLSGNLLVNISANITSLTTLRVLRLTGNQLVSLPVSNITLLHSRNLPQGTAL